VSSNVSTHESGSGVDPTNVRGKRIGAVFIDAALLILPSLVIAFSFLKERTDVTSCANVEASFKSCLELGDRLYVATGGRLVAWQLTAALLGVLYYVVLQGKTGWTPGKRMVGIRVVTGDGAICGIPKAFVRYLPFLIPALIPAVGFIFGALLALVEFILILAQRRHQRLGDLFAKTYVVGQESAGRPIPPG
jgi:RDD family